MYIVKFSEWLRKQVKFSGDVNVRSSDVTFDPQERVHGLLHAWAPSSIGGAASSRVPRTHAHACIHALTSLGEPTDGGARTLGGLIAEPSPLDLLQHVHKQRVAAELHDPRAKHLVRSRVGDGRDGCKEGVGGRGGVNR